MTYNNHCLIVDLDYTVCKTPIVEVPQYNNRESWNKFHENMYYYLPEICRPVTEIIDVIKAYYRCFDCYVYFVTSREDSVDSIIKHNTLQFINQHFGFLEDGYTLLMRDYNDFRPSSQVKEDLLKKYIIGNHNVYLALDDNKSNIEMFQEHNITCLQVYVKGDV